MYQAMRIQHHVVQIESMEQGNICIARQIINDTGKEWRGISPPWMDLGLMSSPNKII